MKAFQNKSCFIEQVLFFFVYVCILTVSVFVFPQVDEHIFAVSTEVDFNSILKYCFEYGNGRLIGNLLCVTLSHFYLFKPLFISLVMTLLVFSLYKLFFNGTKEFILIVAALCLFVSNEMLGATIYNFPSFTNYVVPCAMFVFVIAVIENKIQIKNVALKLCSVSLLSVFSCLFSENTSGIIVAFAFAGLILKIVSKKKITLDYRIFLFSTIIGSLFMYLIPKCANVDSKLDSYHSLTFYPIEIVSNFMLTMDIVSEFILLFIVLSFCLICITLKSKKITVIDIVCFATMLLYILISAVLLNKEDNVFIRVIISSFSLLYFSAVIFLIIRFPVQKIRYNCLALLILIVASVVPMFFINILSHRTFYITFILVMLLTLCLLKEVKFIVAERNLLNFKKCVVPIFILLLVVFSVVQFQNQEKKFYDYVHLNENKKMGYSQSSEESFDSDVDMYGFVLDNQKYFNPKESVIWPKESWIGVFTE